MGKGQTRTGLKASALATALALSLPAASFGAGLGKLTVLSGLGEPLRAEVELNASKEELSTLSAKLAAPAAFRAAGIDISSALRGVKVSVVNTEGGQPTLRLATDYSVSDPFVDLLLEINWSAGRMVREFTFLLDPPDDVGSRTAVAPIVPRGIAASVKAPAAKVATEEGAPPAPKKGKAAKGEAKSAGSTHKVRPGESLTGIAEENRPEGVSLDQMLVALVRGNPDAFDDGNINRLRAGKILRLPDADAAKAVGKEEAHKQVVAQSSDFSAYRRKLASQVGAAAAPKEEAAQQGASGKISTRVEDKVPAPADKSDRLKVSRTDTPRESVAGTPGAKAPSASEEQLVAREKALKEANARLAEVEKNVKELQQLVEMKNQALADLQKQAGAKSGAQAPQPAAPAVPPIAQPAPVAQAPQPAPVAPVAPVAQPPKPVVKKPMVPPPPPPEPPGFFESLLSDPATLAGGGGILALVLGYFGYKGWQRRKENQPPPAEHSMGPLTVTSGSGTPSIFGSAGGRSVDTSASAIQTDFSQSGLSAIDTDEGVDPVAEADVYMAYGRDAQAEEILLDALKNEPERQAIRAKLLEIYAQRRNMLQFETVAGELYAHTGGAGPEWEKAAALGRKLDPHNPLYARGVKEEPPKPAAAPFQQAPAPASPVELPEALGEQSQDNMRSTWTMPGELDQIAAAVAGGAVVNEALKPAAAPAPAAKPAPAQMEPVADLDFDLGLEFPEEEAESDHDVSFDSTVVMGGSRTMSPMADMDFHIDMDEHLGDLKLPETENRAASLNQTEIQSFNADSADDGLDLDLTTIGVTEPVSQPAAQESALDLDLDLTAAHGSFGTATVANPEVGMMDLERTEVGGNLLDFELGEEDEPSALSATTLAPVIDLSDISLDLGDGDEVVEELQLGNLDATTIAPDAMHEAFFDEPAPEPARKPAPEPVAAAAQAPTPAAAPAPAAASPAAPQAAPAPAEPEIDPAVVEETATKLELAQAYEEMGDLEGARELLQEVLQEGNTTQRKRAEDVLSRIG